MTGPQARQALGSRRERIDVDVCVIGAGIAGLIAATRIAARSGLRVVVLESGTSSILDQQDAMVALDTVHAPAGTYLGTARGRGVGGTSAKWAGKLLPLSPHDIAARPYLDLPAWPVDAAELARHTPAIEAMMGVDTGTYDGDGAAVDQGRLPGPTDDIAWRWPKRPTRANHRIDHVLRGELDRLTNLTIWTDATVTALRVDQGRLGQVVATNHRGGELTVAAGAFVIAAGTLESTRLLLLADAQNDGCISRTTDALGRYFNDHFGVEVAVLRSAAMARFNRMLADRTVRGTVRHLHGELSAPAQRAAAIGSAYFDFDAVFADGSATDRARRAVAALRARDAAGTLRHLGGAVARSGALARALAWRARHDQQYWGDDATVHVKAWVEQQPVRANRLQLAPHRDTLGQPLLQVDLTLGETDNRTLCATIDTLAQFWTGGMAGSRLDWTVLPARAIDAASEQAHPAGSLRMSRDPAASVVDPALRVHALANVQVASAAVFPSSGSANPTLTIMQLAMHAADDLVGRLQRA